MTVLKWSDSLSLGLPFMDDMHRHFVELLERVQTADDRHLQPAWRDLIEHTAEQFGSEDAWMCMTGFTSANVHRGQHQLVLEVMREGLLQAGEGRLLQVRAMAHQLASWFVHHVQTLDAALALHLRSLDFDPVARDLLASSEMPADSPQRLADALP